MSEESKTTSAHPPLSFFDKLRVFVACVIAVLLLRSVGWYVVQPVDPEMAPSLIMIKGGLVSAWLAVAGLAVVSAAVGTVLVGRRLPEAGLFAAAVGLVAMGLRGGSMQMFLGYFPADDAQARSELLYLMTLDSLLWAGILVLSWVAVYLSWRWLWGERESSVAESSSGETETQAAVERKSSPVNGLEETKPTTFWAGWPAMVATAVVAAFLVWMTVSRTPVSPVLRGQVIFAVAAGFFVGALVARYFTGIDDARWYALAPLGVALIGYLLGYLNADMAWAEASTQYTYYADLATTPAHDLIRPLPIEYLAVGVAGALAGFWSSETVEHAVEEG